MKLKNKKWTYGFLGFAVVVIATIAYAAAGDRYIYNQNQDKDINIVVNDGGVDTTVLTAEGATSNLKVDTDTLVVDSTNDRVGIGTASPSYKTHIFGSGDTPLSIESTGNRAQLFMFGNRTGSDGEFAEFGFTNNGDSLTSIQMFRDGADDAGAIAWGTQPTGGGITERMRLDPDGNLGINTTNPAGRFHIQQSEANSNDDGIVLDAAGAGSARIYLNGTDLRFYKSGIEAMEIDNGGRVLINTTNTFATGGGAKLQVLGQPGLTVNNNSGAAAPRDTAVWVDLAEQQNGKIECTATSNTCTYVTSSDKRLKKDFRPVENGLEMVLKMKPSIYKMKDPDDLDRDHTGFIAQELYEVYPEAVSVGGDDEFTNPWSIDYGRITPALAAAIQELAKENQQLKGAIASLEARLNALEN